MDLDLRLVRYFVAIADELHFGRAAAGLHISQPALSKQLRRLESDLGFRLLARDSRHVTLTPEGDRFLREARTLLAHAARMTHPGEPGLRMAHIFDLDTSRRVADAFATRYPDVPVIESSMDSRRQFAALMAGLLDVAIIRLTPAMRAEHPSGWRHRLLRLEPFWLIGRADDAPGETASLHERPIDVFGDPPGSALFNAHGEYLSALEEQIGVAFRWLGNPGTFDQCRVRVLRPASVGYLLEFESYALRYEALGLPLYRPIEIQPVYPWSLVWRTESPNRNIAKFIEIAEEQAGLLTWLTPERAAPLWSPRLPDRAG
ncbi:LysR family transcriptional regulator [Sinomonas sp. ASV322]|uniref:LysR family transcriptional regulator n=1 Tax=Sinomonas sp. ASV322 TaxID=3041920 RepID=UPI0027DE8856|nr:LysR family transcriptional regulator [Sinomonas sp. ASV322]MDQ4504110.1 LysR family transcriptional regulator [Sinomonas sp. ASV322]